MNESQFKDNYIATFLATWTATNYEEFCMQGWHERLEKPPVEDAMYLADKAWEEYLKHKD